VQRQPAVVRGWPPARARGQRLRPWPCLLRLLRPSCAPLRASSARRRSGLSPARHRGLWVGIAAAVLVLLAGGYYALVDDKRAAPQMAAGPSPAEKAAQDAQLAAEAQRLKDREELARLRADNERRLKAEQEAAQRKQIEDETRRKIEAEMADKKRLEDEARQKSEAEGGEKKLAEAGESGLRGPASRLARRPAAAQRQRAGLQAQAGPSPKWRRHRTPRPGPGSVASRRCSAAGRWRARPVRHRRRPAGRVRIPMAPPCPAARTRRRACGRRRWAALRR
jgi:hypothetical protein